MRRRTASSIAITTVTTAALLLAACSGGSKGSNASAPEPAVVSDGTVNMDIVGPVTSFDPVKGSSFQDAIAAWAMYDPLLNFDTNGKLIPGLAESWKATATSATFVLKSGVTCSDGTALTPSMVAASVAHFLDPKSASPFLNLVVGAGNKSAVTSTANSITVTLAKPWSGLAAGMALPFAGIVCPSGLKDPSSLQTKSSGTGAFVSASQVAGSSYTLTRRTDYSWGSSFTGQKDGQLPKKLVLKVVTDDNTRANLMATNALQIGAFTSNTWSRFKSSSSVTTVAVPQSDTMLLFNESAGHPTADKAVRLAISQAISREALNKVQSYGAGELITNLGESSYECFDSTLASAIPAYDAASASKALKGMKIQIIGTNVIAGGDANSYILSALQAAGADATLKNMDNEAWVGDLFGGKNDWDITILVYGNVLSSIIAAGGFFVGSPPPNGQNLGAVNNPAADDALAKAGQLTGAAGCSALADFQRALVTNNDVLPLSTVPVHVLFAGGTSGGVLKGFTIPSTIRLSK